jgi:hypothetical protein
MTMSDKARAEYDKAMMAVTLKHGHVVVLTGGYYGWQDYDAARHLDGCTIVAPPKAAVEEDTWSEFEGTFFEGDSRHHGIIVTGVTCVCGEIGTGRTVRWEADMQEVAEAVFEEAFGGKAS